MAILFQRSPLGISSSACMKRSAKWCDEPLSTLRVVEGSHPHLLLRFLYTSQEQATVMSTVACVRRGRREPRQCCSEKWSRRFCCQHASSFSLQKGCSLP